MRWFALISLTLSISPVIGIAQTFDGTHVSDLAQVEVLPGWREPDGSHVAGLHIALAPGWVTYWRAPGDAGIPPKFTFSSPDAVRSVTPHWPTPQVLYSNGMHAVGYDGGVVLPITVAAETSGPLSLSGELFIGICEEICIPVTLSFDTELPSVGAADAQIGAALATTAIPAVAGGIGPVTCQVAPISDGLALTALIPTPNPDAVDFTVIETGDPSVWVSQAELTRDAGNVAATVEMVHPSGVPFALDRSTVRITLLGGPRAIDIQGCEAG